MRRDGSFDATEDDEEWKREREELARGEHHHQLVRPTRGAFFSSFFMLRVSFCRHQLNAGVKKRSCCLLATRKADFSAQ